MYFALLGVTLIFCLGQTEQLPSSASASFAITLSAPQSIFTTTSVIKLTVALTNTSDHTIFVRKDKSRDHGELTCSLDVRDEAGNEVSETKYGRALKGKQVKGDTTVIVSAPGLFPLEPGQSLDEEIDLKKVFDVSAPGKYVITAKRVFDADNVVVTSKPLTITIEK